MTSPMMEEQPMSGMVGDTASCERADLTRSDAAPKRVRDIMLATPKTLPANASVDDARAFFANPKVINAVVVDGSKFVGVLHRTDLPSLLPGNSPIRTIAKRDVPTITADRPATEAVDILDSRGATRLVVVGDDGETLVGLLCLDLQRSGFCGA